MGASRGRVESDGEQGASGAERAERGQAEQDQAQSELVLRQAERDAAKARPRLRPTNLWQAAAELAAAASERSVLQDKAIELTELGAGWPGPV